MHQIVLSQKTIRAILLPTNIIILIICVAVSSYLYGNLPNGSYSMFVFWLIRPCLNVEVMMSCIILFVGMAGNLRYNKCWQGSYAFFSFVLTLIFIFSYVFSRNLIVSLDTVIPNLQEVGAYSTYIQNVHKDLKCLNWEPVNQNCSLIQQNLTSIFGESFNCSSYQDKNYSDPGCRQLIYEQIESMPSKYSSVSMVGLVCISIYSIFMAVFFFLVSEESQYAEEHKPMD